MAARIPAGPPDAATAEYAACRAAIAEDKVSDAYAALSTAQELGTSALKSDDPRLDLLRADLGNRIAERPVTAARLEQIVQQAPAWRYAAYVRATSAAVMCAPDSSSPVRLLDEYLATFGNDAAIWNDLVERAPAGAAWFKSLLAKLSREALHLPHDPSVWIAIATLLGDDQRAAAVGQVQARLSAQTTF